MRRQKIEKAILDAAIQNKYTRTKNYDIVIWDSRCSIKTFESEESTKLVDVQEYNLLDR